jgi:hypothetical protein
VLDTELFYLIIQPNLQKIFNIVPKAAFEVKAIDKFKAATSSHYQTVLKTAADLIF